MIKDHRQIIKVERAIKKVHRQTPTLAGGLAVGFFKDRFNRQGWQDKSFEKWPKRKNNERGLNRSIGVKSGRLKRSIRVISKSIKGVYIGTDVPYAQRFNEGFKGKISQNVKAHRVRTHRRKIRNRSQTVTEHNRGAHNRTLDVNQTERPFIGNSQLLNRRIEKNIEHQISKELRFLKNI